VVILGGRAVSYEQGTPVSHLLAKVTCARRALSPSHNFFFFFFTLVTGPRRSLGLKLSDTSVYAPQIRARLGTTAHFCRVVVLKLRAHLRTPRSFPEPTPYNGNSNSHGARPIHQIISMIKWIRTSRLSVQNCLSLAHAAVFSRAVIEVLEEALLLLLLLYSRHRS